MEFEALLLGVEPAIALGAGLAALALAPVLGALGNTEASKTLSESGRNLTKDGIKWGIETFDKVQGAVAEAGETLNDIVAEARTEARTPKNSSTPPQPKEVEIS